MSDTGLLKVRDPRYQAPRQRTWRVQVVLDVIVSADTDRGAMRQAMELMREEQRYQVEEVET